MVAEICPRMTSLIKNSKWRRDLLKGCIAFAHFGLKRGIFCLLLKIGYRSVPLWPVKKKRFSEQGTTSLLGAGRERPWERG